MEKQCYNTLNKTGYSSSFADIYQQAFIDFAAKTKSPVLDIGAAFGTISLAALKKGAHVIANDIEEKHLEILKSNIPKELLPKLELRPGKIPGKVSFKKNTLGGVLAARSLHFLPGVELKEALLQIHIWLKPKGKLFFVATTPYLGVFKNYIPNYEEKKKTQEWPGELFNFSSFFSEKVRKQLPSFINLLDKEVLVNLFAKIGFVIEKASYFSPSIGPKEFYLDGRELVGLIGVKMN